MSSFSQRCVGRKYSIEISYHAISRWLNELDVTEEQVIGTGCQILWLSPNGAHYLAVVDKKCRKSKCFWRWHVCSFVLLFKAPIMPSQISEVFLLKFTRRMR